MDARTVEKTLELPGGRRLRVRAPAEPDHLLDAIDAATFREDERMPYWAEPWPAGLAFAARLLDGGLPAIAGRRVLELGSGLGTVGIAAALAGAAHVTFSDWFPESLAAALENARLNGVPEERTAALLLDWRRPPADLRFEAIVGADLLYEMRNAVPLLGAIKATLAPEGGAWIADPDRITASGFAAQAESAGFHVERAPLNGVRGWVYRLTLRA